MPSQYVSSRLSHVALACTLALAATGCSTLNDTLSGDKVDYRTSGKQPSVKLEVPPDLTQLSGQARYAPNTQGVVSASTLATPQTPAAAPAQQVAPNQLSNVRLVRDGQNRWLQTDLTPEQTWKVLRDFWQENGFELAIDQQETGVMETNWNENRVKLPQDGVRNLLGKVLDSLYDTGERDKYRTRVERGAKGTEIFIAHRGMQEVYTDGTKGSTTWRGRPSDPDLEAEMLRRLMVKLGTPKDAAQSQLAQDRKAAPAAVEPASSRVQADGVSVRVNGESDQAWRRVGLALDRGGFTIEERDRSAGTYDVRLAASTDANKPGLLDRMGNLFSKKQNDTLTRYRLKVRSAGNGSSTVTVLTTDNQPATSQGGKEVAKQLAANLD